MARTTKTKKKTKKKQRATPRKVYEPKVYTPVVPASILAEPGEVYTFVLEQRPIAKERPRMTRYGKAYTPERTLQRESDIRGAYEGPFFQGNISITILFDTKHTMVTIKHDDNEEPSRLRGDLDNYVKAVLDALNGVAFEDDRQVHHIESRKK